MLKLYFQNDCVMIYDSETWSILRKQYRIIGYLVGCLSSLPRQNIFLGLPAILMPEQVILLIEKNVAQIIERPQFLQGPDKNCKQVFDKEINQSLKIQNEKFRDRRRREIEQNFDKIKKVKPDICKEQFIESEINKITDITEDNMILPLQINMPDYLQQQDDEKLNIVNIERIKSKVDPVRYKIFSDLWERGLYVTDGLAFGGDYLVYKGDPSVYHSNAIVKCVQDYDHNITVSEIVALGRLGNTVKKQMILASVLNDEIKYLTLKWDSEENILKKVS